MVGFVRLMSQEPGPAAETTRRSLTTPGRPKGKPAVTTSRSVGAVRMPRFLHESTIRFRTTVHTQK